MVPDQPETEWNAALGGIAHGGSDARVWHGNDNVRLDRGFPRQLTPQFFPAGLHRSAKHHAVRTGEVYVFEDATGLRRFRRMNPRRDSFRPNHNQLTRPNVALVSGADQIEGASFGSEDNRILLLSFERRNTSHRQRAKATWIARCADAVRTHAEQ